MPVIDFSMNKHINSFKFGKMINLILCYAKSLFGVYFD